MFEFAFLLFQLLFDAINSELITCYFEYNKPTVDDIDPNLCTHLILINSCKLNEQCQLVVPPDEQIRDVLRLKRKNAHLKLLISFTPQNSYATKLVKDAQLLEAFVHDVRLLISSKDFDGFDLDWEFPVWSKDASKSDKKGYKLLIEKLNDAFKSLDPKPLLTAAVAAPYDIVHEAYDVDALNRNLDFVQIMNYDFHVYAKDLPFAAINAPLYKETTFEFSIAGKMNSDYSTRNWLGLGLYSNKTVFGIPTYGRGYTLLNKYLHFVFAPVTGVSELGPSQAYPQVCNLTKSQNYTYVYHKKARSPYLYGGNRQWFSFENPLSMFTKATYAAKNGFLGIMVFDLSSDDYKGTCGGTKYPLIKAAKSAFRRFKQER